MKSSKKLQIILLVIILLISLFSGGVIIKLNHGALKDSVKVGESNRFNNQINSEKLKSAIKVGWENQQFYYYLDQHTFQKLFIQQWINFFPSLPNNQLQFFYRVNEQEVPIAVKIIYTNPDTNRVLNEWSFRIAN